MKCSGKFDNLNNEKIAYHTLSRLLHPDKNLHKGASDAFKILQNAHEKLENHYPLSTKVLEIKKSFGSSEKFSSPPKVISVQTKKKILCRITTLSGKKMDIRAKLTAIENAPNGLSEYVTSVLNDCWEKRNKNGDIPLPDEGVVKLQCVKQIKSSFHWLKEIKPIDQTDEGIDLMITVKEVREKTDDGNGWKDSLEIDIEDILLNSMDHSKFTAECLWRRWKLMKDSIALLFDNET